MAKNGKAAAKGTALAKAKPPEQQPGEAGGALILMGDKQPVPAHIRKDTQRGSEKVGTEDLVIPRLEIVQALSPAVDKNDPGYIQGATTGDLTNSVTNRLYGREVFVVPVYYTKQWLVWKDRQKGGGFFGAYPNPAEAEARAEQEGGKKSGVQVIDTPTHLCLIVNPDAGSVDEILIPMPRTKAKVSRALNSMIKLAGGDRFSRVYRITTQQEKNAKGTFHNYVIGQCGFPAVKLYKAAEALYTKVAAGDKTFVMDTKGYQPDAGADDAETEM